MKIIMTILLFSVSFIGNAQIIQKLINSHVEKLKNAKSYTLTIADKMGEENYDFKPVKEEMSFKEQLLHTGENLFWLSSTYLMEEEIPLKGKKPIANSLNKEQVLAFLASAYDYAIKSINEIDENSLTKEFSWNNGSKLNKFQFLNLVQDHQSHHVGQLIVYLRLNGITPPRYIGW